MSDDLALGEWELHTFEDMRRNDNHQRPIKYWSRNIIESMRWLMGQPAYAEHQIYAPQGGYNATETPLYRNAQCRLVVGDTGMKRCSRIMLQDNNVLIDV